MIALVKPDIARGFKITGPLLLSHLCHFPLEVSLLSSSHVILLFDYFSHQAKNKCNMYTLPLLGVWCQGWISESTLTDYLFLALSPFFPLILFFWCSFYIK